jgi:hypothetical protein
MSDAPKFDPKADPNGQASLLGGIKVPFVLTHFLRWVKRGDAGRYVLQQKWSREVSRGTLALKPTKGPTVTDVWIDVPQGEE